MSLRLLACLILAATSLRAADLFPFVLPWDDATPGPTNLSHFLEKPAGSHGFVTVRDGHLYAGEKRLRIFGVNMAFGGNFPSHDDAKKIAARMAKFGINCVRFHHLDTSSAPAGLLQKDKRTFDPEMLDRLDYFIARLKEHGIYTNLNLHVGLEYPGFKKWAGAPSYFKGVDNFFPPMIEQQRDYARTLLTHKNPHTGLAYSDDPAVAFIEINNENGLIMEWTNGTLDKMPDPFAAELRRQWNDWLTKKYGDAAKLAAAWKSGEEPLGPEMIDTDFDKPRHSWTLERHESATAELRLANVPADVVRKEFQAPLANSWNLPGRAVSSANVSVTRVSREGWHSQLFHPRLAVRAANRYTATFFAKASEPRKITLNLSQAHPPWKVLWSTPVSLTPEWKQHRFTITSAESDGQARLSFTGLASALGEYSFADVSLRPGGVSGVKQVEQLGKLDFFRKADFAQRTPAAQRDWQRFLYDTEAAYWPGMSSFLKTELKARSLVLGSATGFSPWPVQAMLDVVDAHSYWQHPHFPRKPWDPGDWTVRNESMAGHPEGGAFLSLAMRRVAGKPFMVTEYNHAAPNTYSAEAFLEVCALGALQDWDGIFAFAYSHRTDQWNARRVTSFFDIDQHPTKMATLPAALSLFYRADLPPPGKPNIAQTTLENAIESIRKGGSWVDARAYGIHAQEMFLHPIGMRIGDTEKLATGPKPAGPVLRSDDGQLTWDTTARRMLIATPRSAGVVGQVKAGETIALGPVKVTPGANMQNWATITATMLKGESLAAAESILITATGYTENTGQRWQNAEKTTVGMAWGNAPSLVEPIPATITLPTAGALKAFALDERGQRRAEVPLQGVPGEMKLELLPEHQTLWWEVTRVD